jgi:uncharacterized protein (TIGR02118 family)
VGVVKEILLIKRREGLSREEFSQQYEEVHAPLILKHCPTIKRYVRNYVASTLGAEEPDFDCITEVWYEDMEGFRALGKFYNSESGKVIRDSEESFMNRSKLVVLLVDEKVSK